MAQRLSSSVGGSCDSGGDSGGDSLGKYSGEIVGACRGKHRNLEDAASRAGQGSTSGSAGARTRAGKLEVNFWTRGWIGL